MRQYGEGAYDPRLGKGGVNGVGGNLGGLSGNTTGAPVGYIPSNQVQTGIVPGDPMSQIGNQGAIAHGKHTPDEVIHGIPRYWHPGSHDPVQHNPLVDPAGNFIPGTAPKDSDIPLPGYNTNQSSNVPTSITQSATAFPVGNVGYQVAQTPAGQQTQTSNLLNPLDWFSGRNQQVVDEVEKGTYKGGKGGAVDTYFKNRSDLINAIENM